VTSHIIPVGSATIIMAKIVYVHMNAEVIGANRTIDGGFAFANFPQMPFHQSIVAASIN
jgi:hypothetical protein